MGSDFLIHSLVPPVQLDPIDWSHLERTSFGDRVLIREVLGLFVMQVEHFTLAISSQPVDAPASVHKLKGSAQAIGAWPVAEAAEQLEASLIAGTGGAPETATMLARRLDEACKAIARYLLDA